jgi:hypothetical protein
VRSAPLRVLQGRRLLLAPQELRRLELQVSLLALWSS